MRKTKIICTYGPSIDSLEMVEKIILAGANVIRFNFSHGDYEYHTQGMKNVMTIREKLNLPIAILLDTKGPEIRTRLQDQEYIDLKTGGTIELNTAIEKSIPGVLAVDYEQLVQDITIGQEILLDDGKCRIRVDKKIDDDRLLCFVMQGGSVKARRSVNVPDGEIHLPFLSEKDKKDLEFGAKMGVDMVAASFTRDANDIKDMRSHLFSQNEFNCDIISKIENRQGVQNIEEICSVADGIMVARGDLGVELPVEEVPHIQKMIIRTCRKHGKPVITATQMLESMVSNTHPTRAEVSDVANAIYDSTSAIMLSGETAAGDYPVECVNMMVKIANRTENDIDYRKMATQAHPENLEATKALSNAAISTAYEINASAVVPLTSSGYCARLISCVRPGMAIIAPTENIRTYYRMALYWGVSPLLVKNKKDASLDEVFENITDILENKDLLPKGSLIIQLGGSPHDVSRSTNALRIGSIGNVATRGITMVAGKDNVQGLVHIFKNKTTTPEDRILVMDYILESDLSVLKSARGLILQGNKGEEFARVAGETLNIPVITRAEAALRSLSDNEVVMIDSKKGIVYRNPAKVDKKKQ
jgi:pyruvate kinase